MMLGRPRNAPAPGRIMWSTAEIADALGWRVERTRRWLTAAGPLRKRGRYYYAARSHICRAFPEAVHDIMANLPE